MPHYLVPMNASCPSLPLWIEVLRALLTPLIATLAVWIAYQQHLTNKNKLRLDLFEKRYAVYEGVRSFIASVLTTRDNDEALAVFNRTTADAGFLFKPDVPAFIEKLRNEFVELRSLERQEAARNADMDALHEGQRRIASWFAVQRQNAEAVFKEYLDFRQF